MLQVNERFLLTGKGELEVALAIDIVSTDLLHFVRTFFLKKISTLLKLPFFNFLYYRPVMSEHFLKYSREKECDLRITRIFGPALRFQWTFGLASRSACSATDTTKWLARAFFGFFPSILSPKSVDRGGRNSRWGSYC